MSPAPSDVPMKRDDDASQNELGLNDENGIVTINEIDESEESSDEEGNSADDVYSGYVALEQQLFEEECDVEDGNILAIHQNNSDKNAVDSSETATQQDANSSSHGGMDEEKIESTKTPAFQITDTHAEVIKEAMAGFTLPTNNIPEWARVVPEENWKSKLMDSIAKNQ